MLMTAPARESSSMNSTTPAAMSSGLRIPPVLRNSFKLSSPRARAIGVSTNKHYPAHPLAFHFSFPYYFKAKVKKKRCRGRKIIDDDTHMIYSMDFHIFYSLMFCEQPLPLYNYSPS